MITQFAPIIQQAYQIFEGIHFSECDGCSKCCFIPWLLREEYTPHLNNFGKSIKEIDSVAIIMDFTKCEFEKDSKCTLYQDRPLDCRVFPLDIIEEDGEYWWCIFTFCPQHAKIREKLIPLIPKLVEIITPEIFEQYKKQIALTKKIYWPYRLKQYEKIREFQSTPASARLSR